MKIILKDSGRTPSGSENKGYLYIDSPSFSHLGCENQPFSDRTHPPTIHRGQLPLRLLPLPRVAARAEVQLPRSRARLATLVGGNRNPRFLVG